MNSKHFKQNVCRICLNECVASDWNNTLYGHCDITYKDCFYKYTQLECLVIDPFSPMLCETCLNGLYNTHALVLKALESHKFFQETHSDNLKLDHSITPNLKDQIKYTPTEFETVLVENLKVEPLLQDHLVYDNSHEELIIKPVKTKAGRKSKQRRNTTSIMEKYKTKIEKSKTEKQPKKCITESNTKIENFESKKFQTEFTESLRKQLVDQHNSDNSSEKFVSDSKITVEKKNEKIAVLEDDLLDDKIKDSDASHKEKKRNKKIRKPRMCSICSKILKDISALRLHENTHMENRERKETCKVCGLKFYDKGNLYTHNRIHVENREKNHKCDFCNKAFFNKGGLNIHRRIHLGQMIPCSLCTKQFFRQIDLERHMSSHSAATINSDAKKRSRYFVRCKHCGKSILSTSFKSHTAVHLNEPLMKCSICSKEFFRRESCVVHVKKVHQKTNEEYNDFIVQYTKNRITHLFLQQKADIQFTDK